MNPFVVLGVGGLALYLLTRKKDGGVAPPVDPSRGGPTEPPWMRPPPGQAVPYVERADIKISSTARQSLLAKKEFPPDPLDAYNLQKLNSYRLKANMSPLNWDRKISAFALEGSKDLAKGYPPHDHFNKHVGPLLGHPETTGFLSKAGEVQGDWPRQHPDDQTNARLQIDKMISNMIAEGPSGGHYQQIMNPAFRRVGIALWKQGDRLYLTNDFSD